MKHSFPLCLVLIAAVVLTGGCAFRVQVQGYRSPETTIEMTPGMSIYLQPEIDTYAGVCPVAGNELTRMITDLLAGEGYQLAPQESADLILVYSYDHVGHKGRVRFEPQTGPTGGMRTVARGGPYEHSLFLRVIDAAKYVENGDEQVVWAGSASLEAAPTGSPRFVAMLLVAAFEDFPGTKEQTVTRKMYLSDSRIVALGY
jgi:hypothetical protein